MSSSSYCQRRAAREGFPSSPRLLERRHHQQEQQQTQPEEDEEEEDDENEDATASFAAYQILRLLHIRSRHTCTIFCSRVSTMPVYCEPAKVFFRPAVIYQYTAANG